MNTQLQHVHRQGHYGHQHDRPRATQSFARVRERLQGEHRRHSATHCLRVGGRRGDDRSSCADRGEEPVGEQRDDDGQYGQRKGDPECLAHVAARGRVATGAVLVRDERSQRHHHAGADQRLQLQCVAADRHRREGTGADMPGHHGVGERDAGVGEVVDHQRCSEREDRAQMAALPGIGRSCRRC
jgi:hypothetical protein